MWSPSAARSFASISEVLLVSGLAASAALLAVRARIFETQGAVVTGQFDAAWAISMGHATLVLASMQNYYLPALTRAHLGPGIGRFPEDAAIPAGITIGMRTKTAATTTTPGAITIATALTISTIVAAMIIATLALLKPWVLSALYAPAFRPGARFLRWTLLGDYLKVASWIFSIPILARGDVKTFLAADLAAYATFAGGAAVFQRWAGAAEGAAMGFLAMYVVHLTACAGVIRWGYGIRIRRAAWGAFGAGLLLVVGAAAYTWDRV